MPCGYRFTLFGQHVDTSLFPQEFSYLAPERIVSFLRLFRRQYLAENPDQGFFDATVPIMQSLQLLLCQGLSFPDAPQQHLNQFIATALNRSVDQVGRVTHGFGGFESGFGNQLLSRVAIRRDGKVSPNRR